MKMVTIAPLIAATGFFLVFTALAWSEAAREVRYLSRADSSMQPAYFYAPDSGGPVPLLVILHTWSGDYRQNFHQEAVDWCLKKGWAFIHPDFRGPNNRPEATGSELVVQDILSAVDYAVENAGIDRSQIYLLGTSGGGHAALLMAGRAPEIWAGVSAWVPISDLAAWHSETRERGREYFRDMELSCGGPPGAGPAVDAEYEKRSPLTYLSAARGVPLDINAGILDGHTGSVPISHSLRAFNAVAEAADRIPEELIDELTLYARVPRDLQWRAPDSAYGDHPVLFRKTSGRARVTLFQGGHELVATAALSWLEKQRKGN